MRTSSHLILKPLSVERSMMANISIRRALGANNENRVLEVEYLA